VYQSDLASRVGTRLGASFDAEEDAWLKLL
jgi:hypothetical protein